MCSAFQGYAASSARRTYICTYTYVLFLYSGNRDGKPVASFHSVKVEEDGVRADRRGRTRDHGDIQSVLFREMRTLLVEALLIASLICVSFVATTEAVGDYARTASYDDQILVRW